ncbi:MAG: serine/threonine-protein kinase [Myxococcota bacterium]|nr:serine/threonine-protein kinase [Myxococcota bacterium]
MTDGNSIAPPEPKILVGRYELLEKIGSGGMGVVYKARQISLNRLVAIKLLHRHMADSETIVRRFHQEMELAAKIEHSNVIKLFDFGETDDGTLFLVMEYLNGIPLQEVLNQKIGIRRVLRIALQITNAIQAIHLQGVVHRDLKPDNIILVNQPGEEDFVKLLDFGIAKTLDVDATQHTVQGELLGTPKYMSPEQATGKPASIQSDFYSLGLILYHLISGRHALRTGSLLEMLRGHIEQEPLSLNLVAEKRTTERLTQLIEWLLKKKSHQRPPSAIAIAEALHEIGDSAEIKNLEEPNFSPHRTAMGLTAPNPAVVSKAPLQESEENLDTHNLWLKNVGTTEASTGASTTKTITPIPTSKRLLSTDSTQEETDPAASTSPQLKTTQTLSNAQPTDALPSQPTIMATTASRGPQLLLTAILTAMLFGAIFYLNQEPNRAGTENQTGTTIYDASGQSPQQAPLNPTTQNPRGTHRPRQQPGKISETPDPK